MPDERCSYMGASVMCISDNGAPGERGRARSSIFERLDSKKMSGVANMMGRGRGRQRDGGEGFI